MLRRAVLQLRRRPRRSTAAAIAVAEHQQRRATDTTPQPPLLCLVQPPRMGISSTARRARQAKEGKGLVPPTSWSIHDLQLLKKDVAGQAQEPPLSPEEVGQ